MHQQLAWYIGGPVIGLCVVLMRWLLNERLGATGAWSDVIALRFGAPGWLLIGLVVGGFVFGLFGTELHGYGWLTATFGSTALIAVILAGSGFLIGYGAKLSGGCTSGNGLSGNAVLSPASLVATGTFFGTAIAVSFLIEAFGITTLALTRPLVAVRRLTAFLVGGVFGLTLSWSGMTDPEVLRKGLLFQNWYLMLFFASALLTAFVGLRLLPKRALLTGEPLTFTRVRPQRRHVVGAFLFGIGWATADVCPGPIAAQLGQGVPWALATGFGLVLGVLAFNRRSVATEE